MAHGSNSGQRHLVDQGSGTTVAVIDTGVTAFSDGYGQTMTTGYDFTTTTAIPPMIKDTDRTSPEPSPKQPTMVGVRGVAPDTIIMPLKSLGSDGTGFVLSSIEAIDYAVDNGADIINMSLASGGASTAEQSMQH